MSILFIAPNNCPEVENEISLFSKKGIGAQTIRPAFMSAFTSMLIANELKKGGVKAIVTFRMKDAQAAISARIITKGEEVKIIMQVLPNTPKPISIAQDLRHGVDLWLLPSQRLSDAYPGDIPKAVLPMADDLEFAPCDSAQAKAYLWVAPIDGNTDRLRIAIRTIDALPTLQEGAEPELIICGQGKAQNTMPAVREHRAMKNSERVKWLADDYDLDKLAFRARGIIQAGLDPTPLELALVSENRGLYVCYGDSMRTNDIKAATDFPREFMALL